MKLYIELTTLERVFLTGKKLAWNANLKVG